MKILNLWGSTCCGKSTLAKIFEELWAVVYDHNWRSASPTQKKKLLEDSKDVLTIIVTEQKELFGDNTISFKIEKSLPDNAMETLEKLSGWKYKLADDEISIMEDGKITSGYKYNKLHDYVVDFSSKDRPIGTVESITEFYSK